MKRFISMLVAFVVSLAICTCSAYAVDENNVTILTTSKTAITCEVTPTSTTDDGWTSGSFYISWTTGIKYFSSGTIYVAIKSTSSSSDDYYVELLKDGISQGKLTIPCNGIITVNFPNQSAGYYRLQFTTKTESTALQTYEILGYGSV